MNLGRLPVRLLAVPLPSLPLGVLALPVGTRLVPALAALPLPVGLAAVSPLLAVIPLPAAGALPSVIPRTERALRVPTGRVLSLGIGALALGPLGVLVSRVLSLPALLAGAVDGAGGFSCSSRASHGPGELLCLGSLVTI